MYVHLRYADFAAADKNVLKKIFSDDLVTKCIFTSFILYDHGNYNYFEEAAEMIQHRVSRQ